MLRLLTIESECNDYESLGNDVAMSLDLSRSMPHGLDIRMSKRTFNCLGLILNTTAPSSSSHSSSTTPTQFGSKILSDVFPPLSSSPLSMTLQSTGSSQSLISAVEDEDVARSQDSIR